MSDIKGFSKKQIPWAVTSVVAVVAIMICIFTFGESAITREPENNSKTTKSQTQKSTKPAKTEKNTSEAETESTTPTQPSVSTAPEDEYTLRRNVAILGNRCMELYGIAPKSLQNYGTAISNFAAKVPNVTVYTLLAPTSIEFYGPESYRTGNRSQKEGIRIAYSALKGSNVKSVDAYSAIIPHTDEYIYFRTDHHWTARGAYYAYTAFAKTAGFTPTKLEDHKSGRIDGFVGTFKSFSADLAKDPDYVEYFYPLSETTGTIYNDASMSTGRSMRVITEEVSLSNKYLCFIEGDNPIEKIVTSNHNGKKIVMIKESYGNAFAPFIVDNYEEVYILDPRKVDLNLAQFVNANGITDVLFLNYIFVPSNPTYKTALEKMLA